MILNDWTAMQPKIDSHNRWRQRILALEERFVTISWPGRYHMRWLGIIFVNTYLACKYQNMDERDFKPLLTDLSYELMHNTIDADARQVAGGGSPGSPARPSCWRALRVSRW